MNAAKLLYRLRIKALPRYFSAADSRRRWQYGSFAFLGAIVFFAAFSSSVGLFRTLSATGIPGPDAVPPGLGTADAALTAALNLIIVVLLVTGLAATLYTLYLSEDLDVLSATPLQERTVLGYKFIDTLLANSPVFVIGALPASLAYALTASGSWLSTVLALAVLPVVSVLVLAAPTALCILFTMPLMRVLPASRAKEIVAAAGAIAGAAIYLIYLSLTSPQPSDAPSRAANGAGGGGLASSVGPLLESPVSGLPPGSWVTGALSGGASLAYGELAANLALLAAMAAAGYLLCISISGWAYATGRARAAEAGSRRALRSFGSGAGGWLLAPLPLGMRAVALKELLTLRRDLRRLASVMAPVVIIMGAFFINADLFYSGANGPWVFSLIPYAPAVVIGGALSLSLAAFSVGSEGRAYWHLGASPLTPASIMAGKAAATVIYGIVTSLLCCVLVAVFGGSPSAAGIVFGGLGSAVAAAVLSLYGIGLSALFARFDADNPNQALTQAGSWLIGLMLIGLLLTLGIAGGVTALLSVVLPAWLAVALGLLLWTGGCAAGGYAVAAAGAASLSRIDL